MPIGFSLRLGKRVLSFETSSRKITEPKAEQSPKPKHPAAIDHPADYEGPQMYAANGYLTPEEPPSIWKQRWWTLRNIALGHPYG